MKRHRIVILGAGPAGLGAAYRLTELESGEWAIYEANNYPGGLATSFRDSKGFTWDLGGHVMFSHFEYYDRAYERVMRGEYYSHLRESYIFFLNRYVPYPFQNHLRQLPTEIAIECLMGLVESHCHNNSSAPENFKEWILSRFGKGIASHFMLPYNFKVWAHPLDDMAFDWIAERVSVVDIETTLRHFITEKHGSPWGPNDRFNFPKKGGTGELWRRFSLVLDRPINYEHRAVRVDLQERLVHFNDGQTVGYENLISSLPLNRLVSICRPVPDAVREAAGRLVANRVFVVGIGLRQPCPSRKNWIYFPEEDTPFYRVTYFSNYSPSVVCPEGGPYYSLLCETADSPYKTQDRATVVEDTIQGLIRTRMLAPQDCEDIVTQQLYNVEMAYPVPTLDLNQIWETCRSFLEPQQVFSRGRFGAWQYKVGNMDHSFMQGVEAVNRIVLGEQETILT